MKGNNIYDFQHYGSSDVEPDRSNMYLPVIENSDADLHKLCYQGAHELYGENLPDIVEERLKMELDAVKENGYAGLYVIMQKLVNKSLQAGYPVGARSLVGSSFVAFTAGITDVNPLPPHYICLKCHYSDFNSETVMKHRGGCGFDLPDQKCPVCGASLCKDGFDIPSVVFQGIDGKKMPFIDLNFSGQVLNVIKPYAEELFGEGKCFLSGTPNTTAINLLYGYVQKNSVNDKENTSRSEQDKHRPFDYDLLKFDLIRHDDPTMLHRLANETGFDPKDVPFDDTNVMALFHGTDALGITPDQIGGIQLGCLGIPEFGNDYAMQMLIDTRPTSFSHLVKLAGLNHATGAWLGNANELIASGQATLSTVIATRDDIMAYLIDMGMGSEEAFRIMEAVRKGNVAKCKTSKWAEWKADMKEHGVPDWYIRSCEKMEYLFPRAHAAAYVMTAWRIAYYKLHYPQAFYQCWFAMRAKGVSHEKLFRASDVVKEQLKEYRNKEAFTEFEWEEYAALRVAEEMYARGVVIEPRAL